MTAARRLLASVLLGCVGWLATVSPASAQYFGRNKVRYESFAFRVLKTDHFDVYYYPEEKATAVDVALMAERWYSRLSLFFDHQLKKRQPIILYAGHTHFSQTGVVGGELGEGTGGVTEFLKRRVVMPSTGPLRETDHVLGHELVHAFQFDITGQGRRAVSVPGAARLPLWFVEGMAEYVSLGPLDPDTAMWMREAVRRGTLPTLRQLGETRYFPYRYGHAFWAWLAARFGEDKVGLALRTAGHRTTALRALEKTVGQSADQLSREWRADLEQAYRPLITAKQEAGDVARPLVTRTRGGGNLNVGPALSPDGRFILFLSERGLFSMDLYLADGRNGRVVRRVVNQALDPHFESLQFIHSAGAWDPSGRRFAFAAVRAGKPELVLVENFPRRRTQRVSFPGLDEIQSPTWSPDARAIAFSAMTGGLTDLFVYDLVSHELERLTNDSFAELQPAWSPDGKEIAFVTDRFGSHLDRLELGSYRIGVFERASGAIRPLPGFPGAKSINPQWSGDGRSLFFLSDRLGITNVYRLDVASGEIRQLTDLASGVSGITSLSPALSVATAADRLVFSAYVDGRYELFSLDSRAQLAGKPLAHGEGMQAADLAPRAQKPTAEATLPTGPAAAASAVPESAPAPAETATARQPATSAAPTPPGRLPSAPSDFKDTPYRGRLGLDRIGDPYLAVGGGAFGTFASGGVSVFWSDMLGEQDLVTAVRFIGTSLSALLAYQNTQSRWNWALAAERTPFVSGTLSSGLADRNGETVLLEQSVRFHETDTRLAGVLSYPFNRAQRFELSGGYRHAAFSTEVTTTASSPATGEKLGQDEKLVASAPALNLGELSAAFVGDTSLFGATSPVLGQRYRLEATTTLGSLRYTGLLLDYRRYLMPLRPFTLAARVLHYGRYGSQAQDVRLAPLFLGYQNLVRGYSLGSFTSSECIGNFGITSCSALERLLGDRIAVANVELRFPLLGFFGGRRFYGPFPIEAVLFADTGVAWNGGETPRLAGGRRGGISSVGAALRVNLFGFLIGEVDYAWPLGRPRKGGRFQFGIGPGF